MPNPSPRSFRRLLIFRLLLLGIPILLIGQYFTLRKARTGLLETARQNLASSAVRKSEFLSQSGHGLSNEVRILAQTQILQSDDLDAIESALTQFTTQTPLSETCIFLADAQGRTVLLSTCETAAASLPDAPLPWTDTALTDAAKTSTSFALVDITPQAAEPEVYVLADRHTQLAMTLAAPVYAADQSLKYTVFLRAQFSQLESVSARSLVGYTVLLNEAGIVMIHPNPEFIGKSINDIGDADRLANIRRSAQAGRQATLHLFQFLSSYEEWLAGYSGLAIEVAPNQTEAWTVMAVTPLEHALQGLADIRNVLIILTLGLLTAQILLVLYLAQRLSRPIERLCQSAKEIQDLSHLKEVPQNFQVWEVNHLAKIFNKMIKRLEQKAHALQHAWQDAKIANQLKSEFLANTSHELRTPLNAIIGCIRLVKDDCCDSEDEVQEFLETADQAAIHLLGIINDILDIAKIEAGTLEVRPTVVDVRQVVEEVVALQNLQIRQKGLDLHCSQPQEPLWVVADPAKLKQVLLNIVYNAVKFTDAGEIVIATHIESEDHSAPVFSLPRGVHLPTAPPRVIISVADTGIGISPSQQEKLFQPFVMADGSTTRQHQGTGLGLAISRNLITLMGGSIGLHSDGIGKGTQVIFALPLVSHPDTANASHESCAKETVDTTELVHAPHASRENAVRSPSSQVSSVSNH
ncbi:MAG: ATP-binding protein [Leptolyngbyaceae cyanobacterium]